MKHFRSITSILLVAGGVFFCLVLTPAALAIGGAVQTSSAGPTQTVATVKLSNPLGTTSFNQLAATIITNVLGFVGTISLLMFIYGGLILMTSAGAPAKIEKGKNVLIYAIIGMIIVFFSYILVKFVISGLTGNA